MHTGRHQQAAEFKLTFLCSPVVSNHSITLSVRSNNVSYTKFLKYLDFNLFRFGQPLDEIEGLKNIGNDFNMSTFLSRVRAALARSSDL